MAALVQTIPQQNGTVTLLQTRPASSSGPNFVSASQISQPPLIRSHTMSLSTYNGVNNSASYRNTQSIPVAPYAFTSTPGLVSGNAALRQPLPSSAQGPLNSVPPRLPYLAAGSVSSSSSNSSRRSYISQDDSILSSRRRTDDLSPRPLSTVNLSTTPPFSISSPASAKPSPDRYRRGNRRTDNAIGSQSPNPQGSTPAVAPVPSKSVSYDPSVNATTTAQPSRPSKAIQGHVRVSSADDTRQEKPQSTELAKRYRRRSWASLDAAGAYGATEPTPSNASLFAPLPELKFAEERPRPRSAHSHNGSTDSVHSVRSSTPSADREPAAVPPSVPREESKPAPSGSHNRSPLSHQMVMSPETPTSLGSPSRTETPSESPAAQRLADISKAAPKKRGKSRLRRAFSFGSAAELRKASVQNAIGRRDLVASDPTKSVATDELDSEQAAIAAQQEANGLGESIYSHQGLAFTGSTDNLSISSTASSASIMLRKMGRGMKKSTRSLVGLFRPKSIASTQSEPVFIEPSAPQVSIVNIEAERKTVAVNPDPHDQAGGDTVFPVVESTPKDQSKVAPPVTERAPVENPRVRRSIVGGEKERAEVLAAVKKGILKRE